VTTRWPLRRPQITTWASTMSDVSLAARSLPMLVASTRSRGTTVVVGCRTNRASRTWRSGRRTAWASAEAGTVTGAFVWAARASRTTIRRSLRSRAISPPASSVRPGIRPPSVCGASVSRAFRLPMPSHHERADHQCLEVPLQAGRPNRRCRQEIHRQRVVRIPRRWMLSPPRRVHELDRVAPPQG